MLEFLKSKASLLGNNTGIDFHFLTKDQYYFDSACQTLRPQAVLDAQNEYYQTYNACGERVKYKWGVRVDEEVDRARELLLNYIGKSAKEYTVVFTLNTTYGLNLILQQINPKNFEQVVVSEFEHNSVFLPTITWSRRHNKKRIVLPRKSDGSLEFSNTDLRNSIVVINTVSNIDGRLLKNSEELAKSVHKNSGILILDGAQNFSHNVDNLKKTDFDAVCGSGHKMYGPSIGFIIIKKSLIKQLDHFLLGGGTVTDVRKDDFDLIIDDHELYATMELGLQNWAGIIGLKAAVSWLDKFRPAGRSRDGHEKILREKLFTGLQEIPELKVFNKEPSPTISIYSDKIDAHRLGLYLSEQNIMCRSGYFCCHYYLKNLLKMAPLLRVSLGLHNKESDVDYLLDVLSKIMGNV
ncbi:MAG: hypothetical protein UR28_C0027G0008 [Candidatus Peregrinibacteria bacterium GW2011_GWF2_33_10]|nr:MAG: hypothetical protein UR28_C0027G0008 [Candidatus Peregrinibacteria bacterium GW2011_GWF2_33_10]OGJ44853.1 MAG: hypothetical protein A2263_06485 [Candidatus Peregrinibacteria bacterium RIFOXYA2_FULL_33_21]OGJ47138.1 MAG: hypothetical protein A2272_03205 [Candidatus Peregrinibacteria bacterium RIFOXYA12_FULL_33_12]OGJ50539.1 MAG: hypothetical protein A2307_03110 [Candidatus Peregrinibacteria bacterium RIFOXYB2_FULL_33_20]